MYVSLLITGGGGADIHTVSHHFRPQLEAVLLFTISLLNQEFSNVNIPKRGAESSQPPPQGEMWE